MWARWKGRGAIFYAFLHTMARTKESVLAAFKAAEKLEKERKKQEKAKTKKKAPPAPKGASFVVSSLTQWPSDGFHRYQGAGETKTDSVHKTAQAANKRARKLFFEENPWGLGEEEIMEGQDVHEEEDDLGLVTLSVQPDDSEMWQVQVEMVTKK